MPYRLIPETIEEVSIVDIPANKRKFIVVKRAPLLEQALAKLEAAIGDASGEIKRTLQNIRASILREAGREIDEGNPMPLYLAREALVEVLDEVDEDLSPVLEILDAYLAPESYPAPMAYPGILKEEEGDEMEKQRAYGPYAYPYAYPHAYPYPHVYPYAYPYGYAYSGDAGKAVKKLIACLQEALQAASSLNALLSRKEEAEVEGSSQEAKKEEPSSENEEGSKEEKPVEDVTKAMDAINEALAEVTGVVSSLVTNEKLAELVQQEIQRLCV